MQPKALTCNEKRSTFINFASIFTQNVRHTLHFFAQKNAQNLLRAMSKQAKGVDTDFSVKNVDEVCHGKA